MCAKSEKGQHETQKETNSKTEKKTMKLMNTTEVKAEYGFGKNLNAPYTISPAKSKTNIHTYIHTYIHTNKNSQESMLVMIVEYI